MDKVSLQPVKLRPGVGIAVFVISDLHPHCVVLGKRKGKIGAGLWQIPGGHLEYGESLEKAAYREVLEESGVHLKNIKFCHVVNTVVLEKDYHYITIFMKGEISESGPLEPENLEPDKCEGWQWVSWDNMPEANTLFWCLRDFYITGRNPLKD